MTNKQTNLFAKPRITRVVLNVGTGKQREQAAFLEAVAHDMKAITGQAPYERRARKSVAGFNVRQGNMVGYAVTIRGKRMRDFVERFVHVTLPRVRDFRGIPLSSLDGQGNLSVGLKEQLPFPEIHADKVDAVFGVQVTFVTSAHTNDEAESLFRSLGFPLHKSRGRQEEELMLETKETRARKERERGKGKPLTKEK